MADPRFFRREGAMTLGALAALCGAGLSLGADAGLILEDVAPLDQAGPRHLTFLDNIKYREQFRTTRAGACLIAPALANDAPLGVALLLVPTPYKAYALCARAFYPEPPLTKPSYSWLQRFRVHRTARLGAGTVIDTGAIIKAGVTIGRNGFIGANAVIGENVVIGDDCRIGPGASISHAVIGDHVRLYAGVRIGQDGFGFAIDPIGGHVKVPQLGRVLIEDNVEIGANTTIDRGSGPDTVIGAGTWIDNLVQIGHNVKIGKGCILVSQVGISGSTVVEDYAIFAGQAGIAGHLHIGKGARIGAKAGVMRDVGAGEDVLGSPAIPTRQFLRQTAALNRLVRKTGAKGEAK